MLKFTSSVTFMYLKNVLQSGVFNNAGRTSTFLLINISIILP